MASEKAMKRETEGKETHDEPKVLKLASQFESLADKANTGSNLVVSDEEPHHTEKMKEPHTVKERETNKKATTDQAHEHQDVNKKLVSLEEIGRHRQQAQQNSMEAIRAAEERYEKAKKETHVDKTEKDQAHHQQEVKNSPTLEEIGQHRQQAQQNSMEAIREAEERYEKAKQAGSAALHDVKECVVHGLGAVSTYVGDKTLTAKDTTIEKSQQVLGYTGEKAQKGLSATKETTLGAGKTALDYTLQTAEQAKDFTAKKTVEAKDTTVNVTKSAASLASEKAVAAKETGVGVGKTVLDYTVETGEKARELAVQKAVEAKNVAVTTGETAVHYVGEKAVGVKDTAVNAGKSAVSYAGEKAFAAKDASVEASKKGFDFAGEKASEAKGVPVDTAKSVVEDTSNKLAETTKRGLGFASQKASEAKGGAVGTTKSAMEQTSKKLEETNKSSGIKGGTEEPIDSGEKHVEVELKEEGIQDVGLLGAVREALIEIADNAKEIVVGQEGVTESQQHEHQQ